MASLWRAIIGSNNNDEDYGGIEFWSNPERTGWLMKQREYIKTWRRRWFVLKQGKLFWFKDSVVTRVSRPRGVIPVASCLTAKGAEDVLNKQNAFKLSTRDETMYFIADSEKEKEDWINSIGRSIVILDPSPIPRSSITITNSTTSLLNSFCQLNFITSKVYIAWEYGR